MLADRQEKEQRDLRRRARELKRQELGDDYQSSDTEESRQSEEHSDSYGDEDSYALEVNQNGQEPNVIENAEGNDQ